MNQPEHKEFDPIAAKFDDSAMMTNLVRQAVSEAVEKARLLGFLNTDQEKQVQKKGTVSALINDIKELDFDDRLALLSALLDSVNSQEATLSEAQKTELDRRLAQHHSDPSCGVTLDQIARKLGVAV